MKMRRNHWYRDCADVVGAVGFAHRLLQRRILLSRSGWLKNDLVVEKMSRSRGHDLGRWCFAIIYMITYHRNVSPLNGDIGWFVCSAVFGWLSSGGDCAWFSVVVPEPAGWCAFFGRKGVISTTSSFYKNGNFVLHLLRILFLEGIVVFFCNSSFSTFLSRSWKAFLREEYSSSYFSPSFRCCKLSSISSSMLILWNKTCKGISIFFLWEESKPLHSMSFFDVSRNSFVRTRNYLQL